MTQHGPRLGATVLYTLDENDVRSIGQQRQQAGQASRNGNQVREGDTYPAIIVRINGATPAQAAEARAKIRSGERADQVIDARSPLTVDEYRLPGGRARLIQEQLDAFDAMQNNVSVNLQVFLDGNDSYWSTSRSEFIPEDHDYSKGRWQHRE